MGIFDAIGSFLGDVGGAVNDYVVKPVESVVGNAVGYVGDLAVDDYNAITQGNPGYLLSGISQAGSRIGNILGDIPGPEKVAAGLGLAAIPLFGPELSLFAEGGLAAGSTALLGGLGGPSSNGSGPGGLEGSSTLPPQGVPLGQRSDTSMWLILAVVALGALYLFGRK